MSGQLSKRALKKLKKKIDVEYDSRTDITGHFKSEYDQGFCDGADWFFKLAEKEAVSPSLTDDQQVVLEWMKEAYKRTKWSSPFGTVCSTMNIHELFVLMRLTKAQQFQVLATFAEWGKKEEE